MKKIGLAACLDACFEHYVLFVDEFDLVSAKAQEPLGARIAKIRDRKSVALRRRTGAFVAHDDSSEAFI